MSAVAVHLIVPCPGCDGGEIGVRQDYWGNWETRQCPGCSGRAELDWQEAEAVREAIDNPPEWDGP